ncbi:hypothetical protein NHX12_032716 [Muraenolepis orangiensis]|uniref:Major facilitator superfamily associated domain-containing protein n=1 Tax=Muraenolepis orangiensis TaxID=630683 RepID=A0A9Q0IK55_9TELE|nr:hypothetical protein NHX12_032716 [Muraenolepis orangiensis]
MKRTQQVDIKATLVLAGSFHFLCCLARACVLPFLTLYFRRLGLGPAMTGAIMAAKHLITLLWSPLASMLTKHYDKRRLVVILSLVGSAVVALLLPFIPAVDKVALVSHCNATAATVSFDPTVTPALFSAFRAEVSNAQTGVLSGNASFERQPSPNRTFEEISGAGDDRVPANGSQLEGPTSNGTFLKSPLAAKNKRSLEFPNPGKGRGMAAEEEEDLGFLGSLKAMDVRHQLFFLLLIGVSVWELFSTPLDWVVDDGLYDYLDSVDASDRHGHTRTWGLLGAACGAGGAGLLVSRLPCFLALGGHVTRNAVHFLCYVGLTVPTLLAASALLPLLHLNKKQGPANGLFKALRLVKGHPRALLCAATALMAGAVSASLENFLLWAMEDAGAGELHMGVSLAAGSLSQAAFPYLVSLRFKATVPWRVLLVGAGGLALQCLYYSFLWGPWAALPAQLLDCLSTGALWWAVRVQCEDVATGGAERSVRRTYDWLCAGLGASLGSLAGGFVVQHFGVVWLLRGVAGCMAVWCVCLPLLQWRTPHQRRINYSRLLAADTSETSDSGSEQERDWLERALEDEKRHKNINNNYSRRMNL